MERKNSAICCSVSGSGAKFDRQIKENSHLAELMHKVENIISENI